MSGMPRIAIIGCGSAGQRHARNLAHLGYTFNAVDPRPERAAAVADLNRGGREYTDLADCLADSNLRGVVVSSPPTFHVSQAIEAARAGLPVLLEKPLSTDREECRQLLDQLAAMPVPVLLGYTWRWWQPLQHVRTLLQNDAIGAIRHVRCSLAAHLADWHPWEDYRDFFMAHQALGGGALLDESHWIDLMIWFFGMPVEVSARIDHLSDIAIDSDDNVDMILIYDRMRITLHLDLFARPHEKTIRFVGEQGTLLWTAEPNRILCARTPDYEWQETVFRGERNDMFVAEAQEFLQVIEGNREPSCGVADGARVLEVIEAARKSDRSRCSVALTT